MNSFYKPYVMGGAEISTEVLAKALHEAGHEVVVLTTNPDSYQTVTEFVDGIKVYRVNPLNPYSHFDTKRHFLLKPLKDLLSIWNVFTYIIARKIMKAERPAIVHTNNLYDISPSVWSAAKSMGLPVVHTVRDYDMLCLKNNIFSRLACKLYKALKFHARNNVDVFTFISRFIRDKHESHICLNAKERIVVYNAVDISEEKMDSILTFKLQKNRDPLQFVYFGRAERAKGLFLLLEAFRELIAEGADAIRLNVMAEVSPEDIAKFEGPEIIFHGFLSGEKKEQVLLSSDVAVVPSIWEEPFGRTVIEAFSYAMPVIGSSSGAIPELLEEGHDGLIFKTGDKEDLKDKIKLIESRLNATREYAVNATKKAAHFTINAQCHEFLALYDGLVNGEKHVLGGI